MRPENWPYSGRLQLYADRYANMSRELINILGRVISNSPLEVHSMSEIFRNTFFSIPALTGIVFLIVGLLSVFKPPKKINSLYGYRSARSMKTQKAWDMAQEYSGRLMTKLAIFLLAVAIIGLLVGNQGLIGALIGFASFLAVPIVVLLRTEKHLKSVE